MIFSIYCFKILTSLLLRLFKTHFFHNFGPVLPSWDQFQDNSQYQDYFESSFFLQKFPYLFFPATSSWSPKHHWFGLFFSKFLPFRPTYSYPIKTMTDIVHTCEKKFLNNAPTRHCILRIFSNFLLTFTSRPNWSKVKNLEEMYF